MQVLCSEYSTVPSRNIFRGVGTAYRSLLRAYREDFLRKLISVHCTFIRDLRVPFSKIYCLVFFFFFAILGNRVLACLSVLTPFPYLTPLCTVNTSVKWAQIWIRQRFRFRSYLIFKWGIIICFLHQQPKDGAVSVLFHIII